MSPALLERVKPKMCFPPLVVTSDSDGAGAAPESLPEGALQGEGGFGKEISPIASLLWTVPRSPQRQGWCDLSLTTPANCFLLPTAHAEHVLELLWG